MYTEYVEKLEGKTNINLALDQQRLKRIDDYRFSERLPSRSVAIRKLIDAALAKTKVSK